MSEKLDNQVLSEEAEVIADDDALVEEAESGEDVSEIESVAPVVEDDGRAWFVVHCYSGYELTLYNIKIRPMEHIYSGNS